MRYKEFYSTKKQGVAEDKLNEVDFASELGELSVPHEEMINDSSVDGTIGSRKVQLYKSGKNKIYFFTDNKKIDALVYLFGDRVMGMKNFSANKGLIYNLFQYIVNIKKQKVRLTPEDKLTSDGIKWIIDQISRPNGFKITDTDGNKIDPKSLYDEWENARTSGTNGPTEIVIGESRNGKQIRENEIKLIPMDIFGATLKKIDEQLLSRVVMNNILEQGVAENNTDEILSEKAKSKAQQRFFGMARALQKGEKIPGASKELTKVAKTMGKKDVKDFAKTKRKGLPAHVKKD